MDAIYRFLIGPLAWISFIVFIGGVIFRLAAITRSAQKNDGVVLYYFNPKYALRSLLHWLVPFGTISMRENPIFTAVSFVFHVCVLILPFFVLGHVVLLETFWSVSWWTLPDTLAHLMTLVVILCLGYFAWRRRKLKDVQFVTDRSDFILLALVAAPFVFGFLAYQGWGSYRLMLVLHVLSAEILLMAFPFTRLIHMVFGVLTRAYTGSEFGGVRHVKDW